MAKNSVAVVAVRAKKPKTASQLARKERNIALYQERCERLRNQQLAIAQEKRRKEYEAGCAAACRQYVEEAMSGPSSVIIKKWLKDRSATYERITRFFAERPHMIRVASVELKAA
jgi:hypothetical protein